MNTYLIQQKVYTYAEIYKTDAFQINGYSFENWAYGPSGDCVGNAWLVQKEVQGKNIIDAINLFKKELNPILARACFISQCGFQYEITPYLVLKLNKNTEKVFYLKFVIEDEEVPLSFMSEEKGSLTKSLTYDKDVVFEYLTASNSAYTYNTRLVFLIMTLEAMAGEIKPTVTNMNYIKDEILKDQALYDKLFARGTGIRNHIFHGKTFNFPDGINYAELIYQKIVHYFNSKHSLQISTNVVEPPRNGLGKYSMQNVWAKPINISTEISLQKLMPLYEQTFEDKYNHVGKLPFFLEYKELHPHPDVSLY